jgi:hypothetical protein
MDVLSAISGFYTDMENMAEEAQDQYDSMPEGFQSGQRGIALEEAVSSLEDIANGPPAVPEWVEKWFVGWKCSYHQLMNFGRQRGGEPRHVRVSNSAAALDASISTIREYCDEHEEAASDEDAARIAVAREYCDELESHKDAAEAIEWT